MAAKTPENKRVVGGIADFVKESLVPDAVAFNRSVDYRSDPRQWTLLPKTTKESGTVIVDLPKWSTTIPSSLTSYLYGDAGYIYSRTSAGSYMNLHQAPDSHGNGMMYYQEDDYVYYTTDTVIGRYGPLSSSPQFTDDFLGAVGGVPTNTYSVDFEASSSQYAARNDTASLSITGDLCLEAFFNPESLPSVGNTMALVSKWDESGATRSYLMDVKAVSGFFGDGSDGAKTVSTNETDAPIDSACSGTSGATSLSATNASFAAGQIILIHQTRGTGAGTWERNIIQSYTSGTITTVNPLMATYTNSGNSCAQVLVMKQYTNVTVNAGITWTAKAWNGTTGGILAFIASGTVTVSATGVISANAKGFRGGTAGGSGFQNCGEGTDGPSADQQTANGNGGGASGATNYSSGGGGGNGTAGGNGTGTGSGSTLFGYGGNAAGTTDLTTMVFGGGGGASLGLDAGGNGGGIVFINGATVTVAGSVTSTGGSTAQATNSGGAGAGGSILINAQTATLGSSLVTADGGVALTGSITTGGAGGAGRIHLNYYTSYTGTTSPTLDVTQDNNLVTTTTYQARLGISSDGTANEFLTQAINIMVDTWYRLSISWDASTATASFYLNATLVGTRTGTLTAIHNNASTFSIGANKNGAGSYANFFDGKMDDVRVWASERSAANIFAYNVVQLTGSEGGLNAYYLLNNAYTDLTANANDLTASGSPVFSTDVPFSGATTRLDIDQQQTGTGNTYTTPTAISETATNRLTFTPTKDPQKSISFTVVAKGTGDVTVIIHNAQNQLIATKTLTAAQMGTGVTEWIFSDVWRPVLGRTYHAHIISTVNDTTIDTQTASDLEDAGFKTYFQFLVNDDDFHPIFLMLNFLVFGNERYLATWDGASYEPNEITFPPGWRVRCFAYWNEYLAIGMWRGQNIYDFDQGRIYFWDGISETFNFYLDVPEGAINAMIGSKGMLEFIAGYQGDFMRYTGGTQAVKLKRVPKITLGKYLEVFPGAMTMWRTLTHFGVDGNTDSTVVEKGVYSWGSFNRMYPESLSYDYPISTGNRTATNVKIGMVSTVQQKLLIGWQDNISYGVDVVDPEGSPFANGTMEFLIQDDDMVWKDQRAMVLRGDFLPLVSGESVEIKYKLNRASSWTGNSVSTVGNTNNLLSISTGNNREYQVAIDLNTSGSTSPTVLALSLREDDLASEDNFADSLQAAPGN